MSKDKNIKQRNTLIDVLERQNNLLGSLIVLKGYISSENFSSYQGGKAIDAIFRELINTHVEMEEAFDLEGWL